MRIEPFGTRVAVACLRLAAPSTLDWADADATPSAVHTNTTPTERIED
jgi:hypothetical protein